MEIGDKKIPTLFLFNFKRQWNLTWVVVVVVVVVVVRVTIDKL